MASQNRPRGLGRCGAIGLVAMGLAVVATVAVICAAIWQTQPLGDYTGVASPLSAAVDIVNGLPYCPGGGATGLIDDGASLYVSDACTGTTYKYDLSTAPTRELNLSQDDLTGGLALDRGVYYGIAGSGQRTVPPGIYAFNPGTLALSRQVVVAPCEGRYGLTGLAADPVTGDLFFTSWCGLWRISGVDSKVPVVRRIAAGEFGGIAVAAGARAIWVAAATQPKVIEYSPAGAEITAVGIREGPIGVVLVAPGVRSPVAGDLLTSNDDGSLTMIDTHHGDEVFVVAAGGNAGAYLTAGPDGYLYATKSDRVDQIQPAMFGPVITGSRAGQGASPALALSARAHRSAFDAGLPLIIIFAVIAAVLILLGALAGYRIRRKPRSPPSGPVTPPAGAPPRDPGSLPSGTTLRLAVLILVVIASAGSVYAHLNVIARPGSETAARRCLAAISLSGVANGTAPFGKTSEVLSCLHQYAVPMVIWSLSGVAAVLVAAALLYALTPWWLIRFTRPWGPWPYWDETLRRWKLRRPWWVPRRRQKLQDFDAWDDEKGTLRRAITELAREAGLTAEPRLVVNPYSRLADARAFGYQRHGYIRLDRGLISLGQKEPHEDFDAIVRHELAHLQHRDNRPTYVTNAAWRVFVALVLLPYAVSLIAPDVIGRPLDWRSYRFSATMPDLHIAGAVLVMTVLVYLTSRAVFRVRETYADATAALHDHGALDEVLARHEALPEGRPRVPDWLRHHPGWKRRRSDLADPVRLAKVDGLAMFAAGVAIAMIAVNARFTVFVGSLASWLSPGTVLTILGDFKAGKQVVIVLFSLAVCGPGLLIELAAIAGFATAIAWRTQLLARPGANRAPVLAGALPLAAGMMLGEPMSAIYADAGTWGVFDVSVARDLADVAVSAIVLAVILVIVFRWAQESAAARIPTAAAVAVGMAGLAPALFTWILAHNTADITGFDHLPVPALVSHWFGAHWAYLDYVPLRYFYALPGTAVLFAVPCLYLAAQAARLPSWRSIKTALTAGLIAAVLAELAGFLIAIAARWVLGGSALMAAFEAGNTGTAYLPLAWMMWTGAGVCAVSAVVAFRKTSQFALTSAVLMSFAGASVAAVLLLVPLFVSYCGTRGFWCASIEPHDLLSAYGIMAAEIPVYGAGLTILLLLIARLFPAGKHAASLKPLSSPHQAYRQAVLLLLLLISLAGAYFYFTQAFT
jgi:Peptidase family M48